jgi:DNA recombination protein RmuC
MDKMDKQVGTVQNTIRDIGTRTRAINRTLREVSDPAAAGNLLELEDIAQGPALSLAAGGDED